MTQIDFYVLPERSRASREQIACRVADKAYTRGHRVFIHTASASQASAVDDLLWTFRDGSFLPHARIDSELADESPIQVGHAAEPRGDCDVLINLDDSPPGFFSRFERVAEVVAGDDEARRKARASFRFYKDRGYPLDTHQLKV